MLKKYNAIYGQSIFDVCLNTYGSLDFLYKLIQDSGVAGVTQTPLSNQEFIYDDSLVVDKGINQNFSLNGIKYATDIGQNGSVYYIINQTKPPGFLGPPAILPPSTPPTMSKEVSSTSYTSNADNTTVIVPLDKDGLSMIGYDIVQVEKEIRPLKNNEFNWNKSTGVLTLLAGNTVDNTQTLFILYAKTVIG